MKTMRKVFIVGMGQTKRGRFPEKDWRRLVFEAYDDAMKGCSVDPNDIGHIWLALYPATASYQFTASHPTVDVLGMGSRVGCTTVEKACTTSGDALHGAFLSVASGVYDCVLVVGAGKYCDALTGGFAALAESNFVLAQLGILGGLDRGRGGGERYIRRYVTEEDIYHLYYTWMYYATRHPRSMIYHQPIKTQEEYSKLPYDVYPFKFGAAGARFADGGSAILLASQELAKKYTDTPVELAAVASIDDAMLHTQSVQYNPEEEGVVPAVAETWRRVFEMAQVKATDLDVFNPMIIPR